MTAQDHQERLTTAARDIVTGLLGEVGFMRSCIASGERLSPADLARQDETMRRAVALLSAGDKAEAPR